jgi:Domain of unknown function (DUF4397)
MSSRLLTCLFAATALLTVGCDDSSGLDDDEAANVRIVNSSSAAGELDVLVNDEVDTDASSITFPGASSQCVRVDADDPNLSFEQTGGTVAIPTQNFAFDEGGRNTVVIAGTNAANLRVVTLSDALTPDLDDDEARIRVVNGRATTSMGVTVTPWNQTAGTPQVITATTTNPATSWIVVPSGQTVAIRATTTPGGAFIDALNIFPQEGQELIVVAADPVAGTTAPLQWIVTPACSRP